MHTNKETGHPKYELPDNPHAKHRYASAMKHVEAAKAAGKTSEEIHEIFHKTVLIGERSFLCSTFRFNFT